MSSRVCFSASASKKDDAVFFAAVSEADFNVLTSSEVILFPVRSFSTIASTSFLVVPATELVSSPASSASYLATDLSSETACLPSTVNPVTSPPSTVTENLFVSPLF